MSDRSWRARIRSFSHEFRITSSQSKNFFCSKAGLFITFLAALFIWLLFAHYQTQRQLTDARKEISNIRVCVERIAGEVNRIDGLASAPTNRRRAVVELLEENSIALGVRLKDTSGEQKIFWKGTGFPIKDTEWLATAAHVVEQLNQQRSELNQKNLTSDIIAKSSSGPIWVLLEGKTHPDCPTETDRLATPPAQFFSDLGLFPFRADLPERPLGLPICQAEPLTEVGQVIVASGFPTEVTSVEYHVAVNGEIRPTIRFGCTERVSSLDTRISSPPELIQHNIPLVGGFSGAPIVNMNGEVIGIATASSYRMIGADEILRSEHGLVKRSGNIRLLDAANFSFAVSAELLSRWLQQLSSK